MIIDALLLGLSSGSYCVMFCAPVLVPWFFSKRIESAKQNSVYLACYLTGRLCGYILLGIIAGILGAYAAGYLPLAAERSISGISMTVSGTLLIISGIYALHGKCKFAGRVADSATGAALLGFLSGMRFCPPLFAAATRVFGGNIGAISGGFYFILFFIGSSLYFAPFLLVYKCGKAPDYVRFGARVLSIMIGCYFVIFLGIPALIAGIRAMG